MDNKQNSELDYDNNIIGSNYNKDLNVSYTIDNKNKTMSNFNQEGNKLFDNSMNNKTLKKNKSNTILTNNNIHHKQAIRKSIELNNQLSLQIFKLKRDNKISSINESHSTIIHHKNNNSSVNFNTIKTNLRSYNNSSVVSNPIQKQNFIVHFNLSKNKFKSNETKKVETNRERKEKVNLLIAKLHQQRVKEAKQMKDNFKLIKVNIDILKDKLVLENQQQRKVVQAREKVNKDSINTYQKQKKKYLKDLDIKLYKELMIDVNDKQKKIKKLSKI